MRAREHQMRQMEAQLQQIERQVNRRHQELRHVLWHELTADGLIEPGESRLRIKVTEDVIRINGQKLKGAQEEKYRALLRRFDIVPDSTLDFEED